MGMRWLTVVIVMVTFRAATSAAQTASDGTIRGYVKDEQGAVLAGATVSATSISVAGASTAVTDNEGFYRLLNLAPGTYTLSAELEGFAKYRQDDVVVRAGLNLGVNITLQVGALAETVNVHIDTPMLEVSSAAQGVNISGEFQRSVPISGRRHWGDFMKLVPGTVSAEAPVYQGAFHYVHGADSQSNAIQLDGVDIGSSQQATTIYIGLSDETIADVQVKTAAMDASSPLAQGAVISVVSQSGTNELRGALGFSLLPLRWIGDNNPGGTSTKVGVMQPDVALGGPIVRDRLWFFGSYRRLYNEVTAPRTAEQLSTLLSFDPSFEPFNNISETNFYFIKGTAQLSPRHQAYVFYNYDFLPADTNSYLHLVKSGRQWIGGTAVGGRLTSVWRDSLTTRLVAGYNDKAFESGYTNDREPTRSVHRSAFPSAGTLRGSGGIVVLGTGGSRNIQPADKLSLSIDTTYYRNGWSGSHELQTGLLFQTHTYDTSTQYPADGFTLEELVMRDPTNPAAGLLPFHRQVYDDTLNVSSRTRFADLGFYLQDAWRPIPRMTVNAGLRVDRVTRQDRIIDIDVQESVEVGPRLGLNYVLTADQRNTVRASWGRVHDTPSINKASGATNTLALHDLYDVDLDGIFELDLLTPGGASAPVNRVIDPDYHQQYMNEWTVGYRRQLPGRTILDAAFIHREYRDRTTLVDQNGIYDDGVFRGYRNPALNEVYLLTNNRWNWPVYSALEIQATKRTERWQVLGGLTRQWRHIAGTWQPNDPASFIQPDAFADDKGIGGVYSPTSVAQDANSLSGTHMAGSANIAFADYVFRAAMSFRGPWGLLLGANYITRAGAWSGPVVSRIAAPDPRFGPPTVQLSNGRVVSNPLATTIRFAYPTRGEGQFRAPALHYWNLRIGREFPLGAYRLDAAVDVFNVLNRGGDELFLTGTNQTFSPNYGLTGTRQQPRSVQLSARFKF